MRGGGGVTGRGGGDSAGAGSIGRVPASQTTNGRDASGRERACDPGSGRASVRLRREARPCSLVDARPPPSVL